MLARYLTWPQGIYSFDGGNREMWMCLKRFPTQMDYFGWGVLFAGVFVGLKPVLAQLKSLVVIGYAGIFFLFVSMFLWGVWIDQFDLNGRPVRWSEELRHLLPAVATFLMLFFVFDPQSFGSRILRSGWLRFTGIISYEWYLFHLPICHWFSHGSGHTNGSLLAYAWKTIIPVIITFIFSALVYRYFSLPILSRIRNRLKQAPTP
jgi:peptidoglycan/LPS O-acetylase OafA/YrhL